MKRILLLFICASFLLNGCFISRIFGKKEKYGCPGSPQPGELTTDQKIATGEDVKQSKYKGRKSL